MIVRPRSPPPFCGVGIKVGAFLRETAKKTTVLPHSIYDSIYLPMIEIETYTVRLQRYSRVDDSAMLLGLVYMDLISKKESIRITKTNVHRMFLVCSMVASKWLMDIFYDNAWWAKIGGVNLHDLNRMELRVLYALDWNASVRIETFDKKKEAVEHLWTRFRHGARHAETAHCTPLTLHCTPQKSPDRRLKMKK